MAKSHSEIIRLPLFKKLKNWGIVSENPFGDGCWGIVPNNLFTEYEKYLVKQALYGELNEKEYGDFQELMSYHEFTKEFPKEFPNL